MIMLRKSTGTCKRCGKRSRVISDTIGFCVDCIRSNFEEVWPEIERVHKESRKKFGLPEVPPRTSDGILCDQCHNECRIGPNEKGYCGIRRVENGKIVGGRPHEGNLYYYHDPLPTNCVGSFVCPAGTGSGYPRFARTSGPEYGYKNLAVFYHACSFNCLYCQNYHFKEYTFSKEKITAKQLASAVDDRTSCICYFGGDPSPQILHAIKASKIALKNARGKRVRICWETNGAMSRNYLEKIAELSLSSGGCIKFDLKAWDENLHKALCGVSNRQTLANFKELGKLTYRRAEPQFLIASTLLVPGYVDFDEIAAISKFIAEINPDIPYSLLAFYPHFYLKDLPTTSRAHAIESKKIAQNAGLKNVHIGNVHLLSGDYS